MVKYGPIHSVTSDRFPSDSLSPGNQSMTLIMKRTVPMNRKTAATLMLILLLGLLWLMPAAGTAGEPEIISMQEVQVLPSKAGISNDEAATQFIRRKLYGITPAIPTRGTTGYNMLGEREQQLYDQLKPLISKVANGELSSTEFSIPLNQVFEKDTFTFEELGSTDGTLPDGWFNSLIDFTKVMDALLADFPYDLYWFDKTSGWSYGLSGGYYPYTDSIQFAGFDSGSAINISMRVSTEYRLNGNSLACNTTFGTSANAARNNALEIIENNKTRSDNNKLIAYKDAICGLTNYNHSAVDNNAAYGNPWQMIWVFDGDESTNVVCEGYSKAFQFLCDESDFHSDRVKSILVTGVMAGGTGAGRHMWNVVTQDDGKKYLVDVTNSDAGTVGAGGGLFLSRTSETGTYTFGDETFDTYIFPAGGSSIYYGYDQKTLGLYSPDELDVLDRTTAEENATSFSLSESTLSLSVGATYTLTVTGIQPEGAVCEPEWSSSNESVATVSESGLVTAVGIGEADVTASFNGHSETVSVTVTRAALTVDKTEAARGDTLTFTYDLTDYAGSYDHAELILQARAGDHYFEYDAIPLQGLTGDIVFTNTDRGDRLKPRIVLLNEEDWQINDYYPEWDISYSGERWEFTNPVQHTLTYSTDAASAGGTISATYALTGGTGNYTDVTVGWMVYTSKGLIQTMSDGQAASGVLTLKPTAAGRHAFWYRVTDNDGWHYQFWDEGGVQVTGDLTDDPLSVALTWKDQDGKQLDWTQDKALPNEPITVSWEMTGGYTVYEGYFSMTRVSGEADFVDIGQAGAVGSLEFIPMGEDDLILDIEVHDDHDNSLSQRVTIPLVKDAPPVKELVIDRPEQNYYLFPDVVLAGWNDSVYSQACLANIDALGFSGSDLSWHLQQVSGSAEAELDSWGETATLTLTELPDSAEVCVWKITCTSDDGLSLDTLCTVHFWQVPAGLGLPAGWEQVSMFENEKWAADVDEPIHVSDVFRFTDGWCINETVVTVEYGWSSEMFEAHHTDLEENSFKMNAPGIYAVDIVIRCCNIECAFTVPLYIRNADGSLPELVPEVSLNAYGMDVSQTGETRFYIANGLSISDPAVGRAFSLPGVLTCTVENMSLFPEGLEWDMTQLSGSADMKLHDRNNGMNADLDMLTMPASAGDSVFEIRCLSQGAVIWSKICTVHVMALNDPLPTGNIRTGGNTVNGGWYANVEEDIPMSDIFDFKAGWRISGESHMLVSMVSDDDQFWNNVSCGEGLEWDMRLWREGIYPVTVITSCWNVSWGREYQLYIGEAPSDERITGDTLRIPANVKDIEAESFMKTNAQIAIIPEGCKTIGAKAFANSPRLEEVEIPESVTDLDETAFEGCSMLRVFVTRSEAAILYAVENNIMVIP